MSKRLRCECGCGKEYRRLPPGAWISTIDGWHRVRIATYGCDNKEIGCGNDPDAAAKEAWIWWVKMAKQLIHEQELEDEYERMQETAERHRSRGMGPE